MTSREVGNQKTKEKATHDSLKQQTNPSILWKTSCCAYVTLALLPWKPRFAYSHITFSFTLMSPMTEWNVCKTHLFVLCNFGKNGAESCHESHTVKNLYVLFFSCWHFAVSYWLRISACALATPFSAKHRTSRASCLSRTAKPSRGSLPWAQTPTHTSGPLHPLIYLKHLSRFISPFPLHLLCYVCSDEKQDEYFLLSSLVAPYVCLSSSPTLTGLIVL